jgi:hypothetical protein
MSSAQKRKAKRKAAKVAKEDGKGEKDSKSSSEAALAKQKDLEDAQKWLNELPLEEVLNSKIFEGAAEAKKEFRAHKPFSLHLLKDFMGIKHSLMICLKFGIAQTKSLQPI